MKQTLWIVSELFPPEETSTAYILGNVANTMVEKYNVKVICGPEVYDKRKKIDYNHVLQIDPSIEICRVHIPVVDKNTIKGKAEGIISSSYKIAKEIRRRVKREDKVLVVTNPFPIILFAAKLKNEIGFELNILVHDIFPENAKPANVYVPFKSLVKRMFAWAYSKADLCIVLGRDMKDLLSNKLTSFNHKPKIVIIENWGDVVNIIPKERNENDSIIIEYAGNLGRGQGLMRFLDNFKEAGNGQLQFDLYGTGAVEDSLKKKAAEEDISHVHFNGSYFRSQQNEVLNSCDMALVTLATGTYGIGVPSKTYNIMASGKAIIYIGDPDSEIYLLVRERNIGFAFSSEDDDGVKKFLSELKREDLPLIREMGKKARLIAVEEFSKEKILNKFFNIL